MSEAIIALNGLSRRFQGMPVTVQFGDEAGHE